MTTRFGISSQQVPTSNTTLDYTASLGSANGEAAFSFVGNPTALNTITDNCYYNLGVASINGVSNNFGFFADDNVVTNVRHTTNSNTMNLATGGSYSATDAGDITSYITDGVQFTKSISAGGGNQWQAMGLFNGDGFDSEQSGTGPGTTAQDAVWSETGYAFEPDALLIVTATGGGSASMGCISVGLVVNGAGGIEQRCYSAATNDAANPSTNVGRIETDRCAAFYNASGAYRASAECTAFNSDGWSMTMRGGAGLSENFQVLALKSTDWGFSIVDFDVPASGNIGVQNAGIDLSSDGGLLAVLTHLTAVDSEASDNSAIAFANMMFDGTLTRSLSGSFEDNSASPAAKTYYGTSLTCLDGNGALDIEGVVSAEPTGFSATISNNPSTATKNFALVFGPAVDNVTTKVLSDNVVAYDGSPINA